MPPIIRSGGIIMGVCNTLKLFNARLVKEPHDGKIRMPKLSILRELFPAQPKCTTLIFLFFT